MKRRMMMLFLACALLVSPMHAMAESEAIGISDEVVSEDISIEESDILLPESAADIALGDGLTLETFSAPDEIAVSNETSDAPIVLSISKSTTKTVTLGCSYQIEVPEKKIKRCKSSAKKIATVNDEGLIKTKKAGSVKITITLKSGKELTLKLKVVDPTEPTDVIINEGTRCIIATGDKFQLTTAVMPLAADQEVSWSSSDKTIAKVDKNGLVKARMPGRAVISAVAANQKKATFVVNVRKQVFKPYLISHAMGGIDGYEYSNCLEAFKENYKEGFRIFEVDLQMTSDKKVVLCHDWKHKISSSLKKGVVPSYSKFMSAKIYDKYTPLSLENLLELMNDYPDVRIIIDIKTKDKSDFKKQYRMIVSTAKEMGVEHVLDRMIAEVYNKDDFKTIDKIHHFDYYIFSLYKLYKNSPSKSQLKSICSFCKKNGIDMVSMYADWWKPSFEKIVSSYGLNSSVYPVDTKADAKKYFDQDITALYTNFLPPEI